MFLLLYRFLLLNAFNRWLKYYCNSLIYFLLLTLVLNACNFNKANGNDPSPANSPKEEKSTFQLDDGLEIQLVASEPMIQDPVVSIFDEAGRLWVVEMRGFMNDVKGTGENLKTGRVSILEDTDGDGIMDKSHVYIDSLVMPRSLAIIKGGALLAENKSLWLTEDLDGDLVADRKTLLDSSYAKNGLPEHSDNGLWRNIDNWYYNAKSVFRYKLVNEKWIRDSTEFRGQWGISNDNEGRLIYNYNWSQIHGDLVPPNYLSRNKNHKPTVGIDYGYTLERRIYPIRPTPAVNRGYIPGTLDSSGRILEFTAACSPFYYREQTLPKDYYGNVFVCEPSGNLIKRNMVEKNGLLVSAHDPHPGKEFLASTDERFRPVYISTGPDGALYVTDMYRGLIQHGAYITPYLKGQTINRNLELPVHCGRIWRITPKGWKNKKFQSLETASSDELVNKLSNENGWIRDIAQRLMVEKNDLSIKDSLNSLIFHSSNPWGRLQALWTLEGLHILDPDLLFKLIHDPVPVIKNASIRLLESLAQNDTLIRAKYSKELMTLDASAPETALQISLSVAALNSPAKIIIAKSIITKFSGNSLIRDALMSSLQNDEYQLLIKLLESEDWKKNSPENEIFIELLASAIMKNGKPAEITYLFKWLGKNSPWNTTILNGIITSDISNPVKLPSAPGFILRNDLKLDPAKLAMLKNKFEWPGHRVDNSNKNPGSALSGTDLKSWSSGRQLFLSSCAGCHGNDGKGVPRFGPSLVASEWVIGDKKRLALLLLHGMEGPIMVNNKLYDAPEILPVMPSHSTLGDDDIADILTYIRNEWTNSAGPMERRTVGMTRVLTQGRVMPWTEKELNKFIADTIDPKLPSNTGNSVK